MVKYSQEDEFVGVGKGSPKNHPHFGDFGYLVGENHSKFVLIQELIEKASKYFTGLSQTSHATWGFDMPKSSLQITSWVTGVNYLFHVASENSTHNQQTRDTDL